ncbi:hypothetical protein NBT05_03830 [Aquimarina sp. ERC-38]|uniref:hypothetical protein n=1 Tax=Aquimarina sp. ERC-38 TaxID=2949996 RepID=UPI002246F46A|nr:hypothetical protein [Aquimarina sp. ERC-38]UZO81611.1 hypothetical protein NBT05_03830 [Aquimarina sp. ERC-38]
MNATEIILKQAKLTNNCPECFANDGLQLSFVKYKQDFRFIERIPKAFKTQMVCYKCNTEIYPGRFTEDMERVCEYHKKTILPTESSVKYKPLFYILIFIIVMISVVVGFYIVNPEVFTII